MLARQRHEMILEMLKKNGTVHTARLTEEMKVSSETIRKDLDFLEQAGLLTRVHGGAVPVSQEAFPDQEAGSGYVSVQIRNTQHVAQKSSIALAAAGLVREEQVIALDYGSTSQVLAAELTKRFRKLTVITNSIQSALILAEAPDFTVIMTGGVLDRKEYTLVNDFTPLLDHIHIDLLFMTVSGIDPAVGCTDLRFGEARIQNEMRRAASKTVVLADSSKLGRASLVKICAVRDVDCIITDEGITPQIAQALREAGTELLIAKGEGGSAPPTYL